MNTPNPYLLIFCPNKNFPNNIILSREKNELLEIFQSKIPNSLKEKCEFIFEMNKKKQLNIFGVNEDKLKNIRNRKYTSPFLFKGNKIERNKLTIRLKSISLSLQEGGRVINLCDNVDKVKSLGWEPKIGLREGIESTYEWYKAHVA